ncbi:LacI family DNA-binding transcriptional regulator [Pectobacterium punjabense]|uniref:LacI family DNA-binding transcriptional regulator n=1 Tax=Pectobacterium punjabense TaxID=2108399 RepID=UPI0038197B01
MATIHDVCRVAGVSIATVSRVINGARHVRQSTRERVEEVMKELDYRPSSFAQTLATNKSNSIGLVLSDFDGNYYGSLLKQASVSCEKMNKQLLIADGHNSVDGELKAAMSLVEKKCEVIILYSRMCSDDQLAEFMASVDVPVIHFGRKVPRRLGCSVSFDQNEAAFTALSHLVNLKHEKIIYVGPPQVTISRRQRHNGFISAAKKLSLSDWQMIEAEYSITDGYRAFMDAFTLFKGKYTAVVAACDEIAVGIQRACMELGVKIPDELSLVSIDNEELSSFVTPKLTTVNVPIKDMTSYAIDAVYEKLINDDTLKSKVFRGELIIRESTGINPHISK